MAGVRIERLESDHYTLLVRHRTILADLPLPLQPVHRDFDAYDSFGHAFDILRRRIRNRPSIRERSLLEICKLVEMAQ